jgi:TolB-like protein/DNA-binding winged helix-turn-helix (wHTH) protein/Flp pilus assembly protein TadD
MWGNRALAHGAQRLCRYTAYPQKIVVSSITYEQASPGKSRPAMQQTSAPSTRLRFGVFEADMRVGELTRRGKRITLQDQPFQVLAMLLAKPGQLVTREELRSKLWPQTIVDFDHGVNKAISKIRDALGDSADSPRFVETIAGRGYRFLADVSVIPDGPEPPQQPSDVAPVPVPLAAPTLVQYMPRRAAWSLGLLLVVAAAAGIAWFIHSRQTLSPTLSSLAVLPFQNLSNDASQEYFADGMTDELITHLGQISALRVISRTSAMSYKGAHKALAEIARELNVSAVVEGSVLRVGDQVRITAQLIRVPADEHIWAHRYEGNIRDTLSLQSDVAQDIVQHIGATLTRQEQKALVASKPVNPQAYEAYLKGRYFWNQRTTDGLKKSIELFSHSVEWDPEYAQAYSGLADAYALSGDWEYGVLSPAEAFEKSRAAATKALALDDSLAQAHTSLAFAYDLYGWDWNAAEREYRRAIQLNPGYATAHEWYAWHLLVTGRNREGLFELRMAESLDPLSLIISADLADALCIAHRYDESVKQSTKTLEMDPRFALGHYQLGQAYVQKHLYTEAIAEFNEAIELAGHNAAFDSNLAYAFAATGRSNEAQSIANSMQARNDQNPSAPANLALIYVGLGQPDVAMSWLNKAFAARFNPSILIRPTFDPLRSDARFQELRQRIGLPKELTPPSLQDAARPPDSH